MVIKSYAKERIFINKLNERLEAYADSRLKRNKFSIMLNFFFGAGMNGLLIFSVIYYAFKTINNTTSYGTIIATMQIVTQLRAPLASAYSIIPNYYSMIGSVERIMEIESYPIEENINKIDLKKFYKDEFKSINLDHISFSYNDNENNKQTIDDFDLTINKGSFIGITGPSGCVKSTLFMLLLSLYKPLSGLINITTENDRFDFNEKYRELFAYVPQDNRLLKGTIRDSICFGNECNEEKMCNVISIACCDFVSDLPGAFDYEIMENGSGVSEGQMQRIALARALYSDHPILLLDEATGSLNEELEIEILKNLKHLTDRTVLLITHHKKNT